MTKKTTKKKQSKKTTKKKAQDKPQTPLEFLDILDNFLATKDFNRREHQEIMVITSQLREVLGD